MEPKWNPASSTPQQYLGDLISANNLLHCTGFDQGTQLFNQMDYHS